MSAARLSSRGPPSSRRRADGLDRYEVQAELARGGMGRVYRVFDRVVGEVRVMKRAGADATDERLANDALDREYGVLASLRHPCIIRVYDYGIDEQGHYYTMELLEGQDMRDVAPLPFKQACSYLRDIAASLALLHARRLLHRDLSPGNVRATSDGRCKLLDFGALSSFGRQSWIVGTPPTIAPEAFKQSPLDQRTDLYSLGTLAYWMLTRRHAYPAREIRDLPEHWRNSPQLPSVYAPDVPSDLDALVLALLRTDPLARPASAAEVMSRLDAIADLPAEDEQQVERLAQSFLQNPPFVGRASVLSELDASIARLEQARGGVVRIQAAAGMGCTRLLDEVGLRARVAGAILLSVDAGTHRHTHGTARALALQLLGAVPQLARERATRFRSAIAALGEDVALRLSAGPAPGRGESAPPSASAAPLEGWFCAVSRARPLVIQVDSIEQADDASLGLLLSLAQQAPSLSLLLMLGERPDNDDEPSLGLSGLRQCSKLLELLPLKLDDVLGLVLSLFGEVPNAERFAEWLHESSAGRPLHAIELCRQLVDREIIRYAGGMWTLPKARPEAASPAALGDALRWRLGRLSEPARILAECSSLIEAQLTFELCCWLSPSPDEAIVREIVAELVENDVIQRDPMGFRISSSALREALIQQMDELQLERNHRRLGEALKAMSDESDAAGRIQAGRHLILGGEDEQGAELIASVAQDGVKPRLLAANLHRTGEPFELALRVYSRFRRSIYVRLPLLCALAQAGYYQDRRYAERYGDAALDALEDVSGLGAARRLRPWIGRWPSLLMGILGALVRFWLTPRRDRPGSFSAIFLQLFGTVTTLTATACVGLDAPRVRRVAAVLEPFAMLPERLTPAGIYLFCHSLEEIGGENAAAAYATFNLLVQRFGDRRYYPTLPVEARRLYLASAHFARATFSMLRANGADALDSADALDTLGIELYAMIASQIRYLFHMLRGELNKANPYRRQVELHAARMGSLWQVETFEAALLMCLFCNTISDLVATTRLVHQLEAISARVPTMNRYKRLASDGLAFIRGDLSYTQCLAHYEALPPRAYIGWSATMGVLARAYNTTGDHAKARVLCERAQSLLREEEHEYVALFLVPEIEFAMADAGLGQVEPALERIDRALFRFRDCDHPLLMGLLHEARARISWVAGDAPAFERSRLEVERWFRPSGMSALITKCEALLELRGNGQRRSQLLQHEQLATRMEKRGQRSDSQARTSTDKLVKRG